MGTCAAPAAVGGRKEHVHTNWELSLFLHRPQKLRSGAQGGVRCVRGWLTPIFADLTVSPDFVPGNLNDCRLCHSPPLHAPRLPNLKANCDCEPRLQGVAKTPPRLAALPQRAII